VFERHIKAILLCAGEEFSLERIVTPSEYSFKTANICAATIAITLFSNILAAQAILESARIIALAESESTSEAALSDKTVEPNLNKSLAKQNNYYQATAELESISAIDFTSTSANTSADPMMDNISSTADQDSTGDLSLGAINQAVAEAESINATEFSGADSTNASMLDSLWPEEDTAPEAYIDELIDPYISEDADIEAFLAAQESQKLGYRNLAVETSGLVNSNSGSNSTETEYGIDANYQRQTANLGTFEIQASGYSYENEQSPEDTNSGGSAVVHQRDFALSGNFMMDNSVGVHRILTDHNINNSRNRTSAPLILGITTRASRQNQSFQFSAGRLGEQVGNLGRSFEKTEGSVAHAQYSSRFLSLWESTLELSSTFDSLIERENGTAIQGSLRYGNRDTDFQFIVNSVVDEDGEYSLSAGGKNQNGRSSHDYGLYYYGEDLMWLSSALPENRSGLYYNIRYDGGWFKTNGNIEVSRTLAERDGLTGNVDRLNGSFGLHYRRNLRDSVSLNSFYSQTHLNELATEADVSRNYLLNVSLNRQHDSQKSSHLSMNYSVDGASDLYRGDSNKALNYEFNWATDYGVRTGFELGYTQEKTDTDKLSGPVLGMSLDYLFSNNLVVSGYARYLGTSRANGNSRDDWQASINANMPIARSWSANLNVNYGQSVTAAFEPEQGVVKASQNTHTVLFSIRYEKGGGQSLQPIGANRGLNGSGSIKGLIYFDENRDGIRQASEQRADGVEVYLDGKHLAITNPLGEFNFPSVYTGEHTIFVAEDTLPLPLTLDGEQDYPVLVKLRDQAIIEIPTHEIDDF